VEPAHPDAALLVLAHPLRSHSMRYAHGTLGSSAQFDTLRLRLVKLAVRVVEMQTQVKLHLPSHAPCQSILAFVLGRVPRIVS